MPFYRPALRNPRLRYLPCSALRTPRRRREIRVRSLQDPLQEQGHARECNRTIAASGAARLGAVASSPALLGGRPPQFRISPSACCRVRLTDDFPFAGLVYEAVTDPKLHRQDAARNRRRWPGFLVWASSSHLRRRESLHLMGSGSLEAM